MYMIKNSQKEKKIQGIFRLGCGFTRSTLLWEQGHKEESGNKKEERNELDISVYDYMCYHTEG